MSVPVEPITTDELLGGRVQLKQPAQGNRASIDAVLLAAAIRAEVGQKIADFGCGTGASGLCVAAHEPGIALVSIDIDARMTALCVDNHTLNCVTGRVLTLDICAPEKTRTKLGLPRECVEQVMANPPYHTRGTVREPLQGLRRTAFVGDGRVDAWVRAGVSALRPRGTMTMIHRGDALGTVLAAFSGAFGGLAVLPVLPRADRPASRILVQGTKGSRAPLRLMPPLVLHEANGTFTARTQAILQGGIHLHLSGEVSP